MQIEAFQEQFSLFSAANPATLEWLLSVATEHEYPPDRTVLVEDAWGNAVYLIGSGWVKVRRLGANADSTSTLAILGQGDFFGEMAILDESPRSTDVVSLSAVTLLSIPAQRFIQALMKDPQLHLRLLQQMVRRLRQTNARFQILHQLPAVKLAYALVNLVESYSHSSDLGYEIFNIPLQDLADVADITLLDVTKVIEKLMERGWIQVIPERQVMVITNLKQLTHLATQMIQQSVAHEPSSSMS
jgi:CRP-like cAMP-binding protein